MELSFAAVLGWVALGLVVGVLARLVLPGADPMGWFATVFLGVVGAFVGGLLAYSLRLGADPHSPAGWILSVIGAVVALGVYQSAVARRPA
ncbi:MAG TPA: GlsB/YeaQ/YmgE family stress response membrane protein [Gemmataceae bacterium]|jgi:uncharacterized membrane protein YeaQ/YmgE (transglycosylase-associated protein family)